MKTNMYSEKIKFYNKAFPVANPNENKQHSQGIQILSNRDLYPNTALLDTVSPNIQGDNCWNKYRKLSSDSLHHHPKLHHSQHISSHHQQLFFWGVFFFYLIFLRVVFLFYFFLRMMVDHQIVNFFPLEVPILVGQVLFSGLFTGMSNFFGTNATILFQNG